MISGRRHFQHGSRIVKKLQVGQGSHNESCYTKHAETDRTLPSEGNAQFWEAIQQPFSSLYLTRERHPKPNHYNISCFEVSDTIWGPLKGTEEGGGKKVAVGGDCDLGKEDDRQTDDTSAARSLCGDIAQRGRRTDIRSRLMVWFFEEIGFIHIAWIFVKCIYLRLKTCETRFHGTTHLY